MVSCADIFDFFKKEIVFFISLILAILSCFFVNPSADYLNYINWDTIILLFVIMLIVEILKNLSLFEILVCKLLNRTNNARVLVFILVFICFFSSILITNDVSLIIFVPFAILALKKVNRKDLIILTVSLQTIAANVGCMVLPIGAPHNIVLYTSYNIGFQSFLLLLAPYILVSVIFVVIIIFFIKSEPVELPKICIIKVNKNNFIRKVFLGVDYYLLLTFIALFILIGNLERIPFFSSFFKSFILGNEVICGVIVSQFISNVPAAMLLTGFSSNYNAIIIGINIGGFGTLIASMANLISYKLLADECDEFKTRYLFVFTVLNVLLLLILLAVYYLTS